MAALDDPFKDLQLNLASHLHLLEALHARSVTLIVVTHDPAIGARARRRVAMEDGAIACDTRAAEPGMTR